MEGFPTNLLSALKFSDSAADCSNLKKASVLREISDSLIRGNVDEGTLDLLETLEKLLLQEEGSKVLLTESHKSAYCWTAAECTVRFMGPLSVSEGLYEDALERIWTKRIGGLKESGLVVSEELLKWEADLRKAVEDAEVYDRIREMNVRYTAVCFLNRFLEEQWEVLGSSSLELVAQRLLLRNGVRIREDTNVVDDGEKENEDDNRDVHGVECPQQEQEASLDKGDEMVARELKDYLVEIQRRIDLSSTRQSQEPITPQPSRVDRSGGTSGQQQDNSSEIGSTRLRPRLPTPEPLNVSPLKKNKANPKPRRPTKFWTIEEVDALREGVKEHGKSWKYIKDANPVVFAERTEVDLKDKWRNMVR
ncbi:hypothetical protein Bca52824_067456 [Brassica carinata]|uniref:Uncharacterized protein n=1 Tax=Brassica carinata TaxID=52824 RepID=A0A8X7UEB1_BRACI|nr:hypothetical protein Bca52824_067456 [Brassica carinata]